MTTRPAVRAGNSHFRTMRTHVATLGKSGDLCARERKHREELPRTPRDRECQPCCWSDEIWTTTCQPSCWSNEIWKPKTDLGLIELPPWPGVSRPDHPCSVHCAPEPLRVGPSSDGQKGSAGHDVHLPCRPALLHPAAARSRQCRPAAWSPAPSVRMLESDLPEALRTYGGSRRSTLRQPRHLRGLCLWMSVECLRRVSVGSP